jgi:hypothetical protein
MLFHHPEKFRDDVNALLYPRELIKILGVYPGKNWKKGDDETFPGNVYYNG